MHDPGPREMFGECGAFGQGSNSVVAYRGIRLEANATVLDSVT